MESKESRQFKIPNSGIIVKVYKTSRTYGRLLLPVQKNTQQARVKFVGDETTKLLKPGDDILFDPYKGIPMINDKLLYLEQEDVLARIDREVPS